VRPSKLASEDPEMTGPTSPGTGSYVIPQLQGDVAGPRREAVMTFLENLVRVTGTLEASRQEAAIARLVEVILPEDLAAARGALASDNLALRDRLVRQTAPLTSAEVAAQVGRGSTNRYATAARWRKAGDIISVNHRGVELYPAFQFRDSRPHPAIKTTLAALPASMSPWQRALVLLDQWLAGREGASRPAGRQGRGYRGGPARSGGGRRVTPPALPRPPFLFPPVNKHRLVVGTVLHRTHARAFRSGGFNPCLGRPARFAPFQDAVGACMPTLYAATTREAACFETIFHDIEANAAFKTVRLDQVDARSVSRIAPRRDLSLAGLFTPGLKAWGLQRRDLIDTPKSTYAQTVSWAAAIYAAHGDGLIWTSWQCDPEQGIVLYGDRVTEAEIETIERLEAASSAALLLELRAFGRRAGIDIVS